MIFKRRKTTPEPVPAPSSSPSTTALPDVDAPSIMFPFASTGTVYWVEFHVVNFLRARGHQPQMLGTSIRIEDGREFGLHNLVAAAASTPGQDIEELVHEHMTTLLDAPAAPDAADAPVDPSTIFVRLYDRSRLPLDPTGNSVFPSYVPVESFPGLLAVLAFDQGDTIRPVFDERDLPDADIDTAYRFAFQNLYTLPAPSLATFPVDESQPNSVVHLFTSEQFGASRALALPLVLADLLGESIPEHGALVVMPNRDVMAVHLIKDASVASVIPKMVQLGEELCDPMPGPISPVVYHMTPNLEATRFARLGDVGPVVEAVPSVAESLRQLGVM